MYMDIRLLIVLTTNYLYQESYTTNGPVIQQPCRTHWTKPLRLSLMSCFGLVRLGMLRMGLCLVLLLVDFRLRCRVLLFWRKFC